MIDYRSVAVGCRAQNVLGAVHDVALIRSQNVDMHRYFIHVISFGHRDIVDEVISVPCRDVCIVIVQDLVVWILKDHDRSHDG